LFFGVVVVVAVAVRFSSGATYAVYWRDFHEGAGGEAAEVSWLVTGIPACF